MASTKFTLNQAHNGHPAGTSVTKLKFCDYGLAADDTRKTGVQHFSVTLDDGGDYPSFTVPEHILLPA